jgi:aryl-alcohol dehydrogenase-like predicted oxidoreductase
VPSPGPRRRARLEDNAAAAALRLSKDELARLDAIAPKGAAAGERYPAAGMASVNR